GSPVGVEFYDHDVFPTKYRGACFLADWSIGAIWVIKPERHGASYKGKAEKFCTGAPMNITDLAVGPDGALYFTMGGRNTQGGVFRIKYVGGQNAKASKDGIQRIAQPLAAWSRLRSDLPYKLDIDQLLHSKHADTRAEAIWLIGVQERKDKT